MTWWKEGRLVDRYWGNFFIMTMTMMMTLTMTMTMTMTMMMTMTKMRIMQKKELCANMFIYSSYETTFTKVVQNIFEVNLQSLVITQFKKSPHFSSKHVLKKALRATCSKFHDHSSSSQRTPYSILISYFQW